MTDLEHLLIDDAERDRRDLPAVKSLGSAIIHARAATGRRRAWASGLVLSTMSIASGVLIYAEADGAGPPQAGNSHLAAYDQILGADPTQPAYVLVVGPADTHTTHCTRVLGQEVTYRTGGRLIRIQNLHPQVIPTASTSAIPLFLPSGFPDHAPPGPYFLFRCPRP